MFGDKMKMPEWIHPDIWSSLTDRQRDYFRLVKTGRYTKIQIMRYLYIESNVTYWRFRKNALALVSKGNKIKV